MATRTLQVYYSNIVPDWPIPVMLRIYNDTKDNLWSLVYSRKSLKKFSDTGGGVSGVFGYALAKPSPEVISGEVKSETASQLILETKDDEYHFERYTKEELQKTEQFRKEMVEKGIL